MENASQNLFVAENLPNKNGANRTEIQSKPPKSATDIAVTASTYVDFTGNTKISVKGVNINRAITSVTNLSTRIAEMLL